jgi:hypothetical protein
MKTKWTRLGWALLAGGTLLFHAPAYSEATTQPFSIIVEVGRAESATHKPLIKCEIDSNHAAIQELGIKYPDISSAASQIEAVTLFHFMPQIPSLSISIRRELSAEDERATASGDPGKSLTTIFEDYETVRYIPAEQILKMARKAVEICGYNYTAFDLPTDPNYQ